MNISIDMPEIDKEIRRKQECANGNHDFIRINDGNVKCKKCGRFAKVGYLYLTHQKEE